MRTKEQVLNWVDYMLKSNPCMNLEDRNMFNAIKYYITENQTDGDLISRELAKQMVRDKFKDLPERVEINTVLNEVPSVKTDGDLISRQAVLNALYELCDTGESLKENPWRDNPHIDALTETVEQIPSVKPLKNEQTRWIPVKERLPETDGDYLVTTSGNFGRRIDIAWFTLPDKTFNKASEVFAWMPLLKPYKEE